MTDKLAALCSILLASCAVPPDERILVAPTSGAFNPGTRFQLTYSHRKSSREIAEDLRKQISSKGLDIDRIEEYEMSNRFYRTEETPNYVMYIYARSKGKKYYSTIFIGYGKKDRIRVGYADECYLDAPSSPECRGIRISYPRFIIPQVGIVVDGIPGDVCRRLTEGFGNGAEKIRDPSGSTEEYFFLKLSDKVGMWYSEVQSLDNHRDYESINTYSYSISTQMGPQNSCVYKNRGL